MNFGVTKFCLEMSSDSCSSQIQLRSLPQMDELLSFWADFVYVLKPKNMQEQGFFNKKVNRKTLFIYLFIYLLTYLLSYLVSQSVS